MSLIAPQQLRVATIADMPKLQSLATESYPATLLPQCLATLRFHEGCLKNHLNDGRTMFVVERAETAIGGCGLHHFIWGPDDICWASWFFVKPDSRSPSVALFMLKTLLNEARKRGFARVFVETPSDNRDYARVASYLPRAGFTLQARLPGFYAPGIDQLIFGLSL